MLRRHLLVLISITALPLAVAQEKNDAAPKKPESATGGASSVLDFTVKDIDGKDVALSKYKGKVVMLVNVASRCGMTPQYEQLQQLNDKYGKEGLVILGFPANNFGGQEPGTNEEIKSFCTGKYHVTFDMFSKVSVKGDDCCDLYKFLTSPESNGALGTPIQWNFTKFLVGRDGKVIGRFEPRERPDGEKVVKAIEGALKAAAPAKATP